MKVVSYCAYGTNPMYLRGMTRNIEQVRQYLPEWEVRIVVSTTVPFDYRDTWMRMGARILETAETGGRLMAMRFLVADEPEVEVMVVRDADSRWGPRDLHCLRDFLDSDYTVFTIRDHPYHLRRIMGGQWGMKRCPLIHLQDAHQTYSMQHNMDVYHSDEEFLVGAVYEPLRDKFVAYTSGPSYPNEAVRPLPPRKNIYDFCGNVIDFVGGCECAIFSIHGRLPAPVPLESTTEDLGTPESDTDRQ